jgi:hypothetical protein
MAIECRDFLPVVKEPGFFIDTYESFRESLKRANEWIAAEKPDLINVETVVLPNVHNEDGSEDTDISTGDSRNSWHQFVRVWYRA